MERHRQAAAQELLGRALTDPVEVLGGIEGNVEAKALAPALVMLGWDPAIEIHWQFQVAAASDDLAMRSVDAVVADDQGIWAVCEAKAQNVMTVSAALQGAADQVLHYRDALHAPVALLTDGVRWMLWGGTGMDPAADVSASAPTELGEALTPWLGRDVAGQQPWASSRAWTRGRKVATTRAGAMAPAATVVWDPSDCVDPVERAFKKAIGALTRREPQLIARAAKDRLYVDVVNGRTGHSVTIVEYKPPRKVVRLTHNLEQRLGISHETTEKWFAAVGDMQHPDDVDRALTALEHVIAEVRFIDKS